MIVAGADGCRDGWVVVYGSVKDDRVAPVEAVVVRTLSEIPARHEGLEVLALDIPIGLADSAEPGGRECDRACRTLLGARKSSVFSPPVRAVLECKTYEEALRVNRASSEARIGLSKQSWNIVPKIREADAFVNEGCVRAIEAHPELIFSVMTGSPMEHAKRTAEGKRAREQAIRDALGTIPSPDGACAPDDLLDACACLWTASRVAAGNAMRLPPEGEPAIGAIYA